MEGDRGTEKRRKRTEEKEKEKEKDEKARGKTFNTSDLLWGTPCIITGFLSNQSILCSTLTNYTELVKTLTLC